MKEPSKQEYGVHSALTGKAGGSCPSCGGQRGWHLHAACEGLKARWAACIVIHSDGEHRIRRCRLSHGWDVMHRLTRRGARHFHQYTGEGLYCEHHARELADRLNLPAQEVA